MVDTGLDFEGPVTIMFTDIVGSTALRTALGDEESDKLFREHDELIRTQISENNGRDQTAALGDGFLAVFASTRRALNAAVGIQRSLDAFNRTRSGAPLRVRIGLNTGEVALQGGQLSGAAVHAASRVCAAADGGQILVSDVTRQLVGTIPDLSFLDLGEHDLKGFPQPWRLWEAVWVRETAKLPQQVFVGRDDELAFLREKLDRTLDGHGGIVLVGGEPGVGKTTLVRQFIREAEARGGLALFGRCYEIEGALPYSPFVEMLEQGLGVMPPEMVLEDMGEDAAEVARMVPAIRRRFPNIPPPLDLPPEQQRRYFFNAVGAFIGRAAARFPLVLVMDDVHWADVPSLLLIEHMAELVPGMRVLGIGTYRDTELDMARPLAATLDRMVRARTVERVAIKRFDRAGVTTMIESLAGRTPPQPLVDAIFSETEGNPFFVDEVYRHLVEDGKVFDTAGDFRTDIQVDELDVPESVRLVVGRRLERLGTEAQKAHAAGAVVGRGFPFSMLEELTDITAGRLLDIVEEAEAARVIVPEELEGEVHYSFAHELIRQTLLSSLSLLRRQRLHLAVADAMERRDKSHASEIAHHLLQAGVSADRERTLACLERAADQAMTAAAYEEALRAIDDALSLVSDDPLRAAQLHERQGQAIRVFGRFDECLGIWDNVVDVYAEHGEFEAAAELCWQIAYQHVWLNRFPEAFASYTRGLEILGDRQVLAKAALVAGSGLLTGFAGAYADGMAQLDEAERIALLFDDKVNLGRAEWGRCLAEWSFGKLPEAIEAGRRAVANLRQTTDLFSLADALAWLSFPLATLGLLDESAAVAAEALEAAVKAGHITAEVLSRRGLMLSRTLPSGDLEAQEAAVRKDLELCLSMNSPWSSQSYAWIGVVLTLRGRIDEGLEMAEQSALVEPASSWSGVAWASRLMNRSYAGDTVSVEAMVDDQLEVLRSLPEPAPFGLVDMVNVAAEAAAVLGRRDWCAAFYPRLAVDAEQVPLRPFDCALLQRVAGMAAACTEDWDRAERHFETALKQASSFPAVLDEPQVRHFYGKMLLDRGDAGDRRRARELLDSALDGYRRMGIPIRAAMVEELLTTTAW
ncbi:MAG: ATP-binding protein [Mycobacteriales bacterium]